MKTILANETIRIAMPHNTVLKLCLWQVSFSYNAVKLFFFSRYRWSTVSHLGEPVTEAFSISIPSFSALLDHYFTASSDMWYHSTTILSAHLLIAFLTLCPPVILALIVIQSFAKIEKAFRFCLSDVYIECLLHASCWSTYPLAVPNIGYCGGTGLKRKIYEVDYLSIVSLSGMCTVDQIIFTYFW